MKNLFVFLVVCFFGMLVFSGCDKEEVNFANLETNNQSLETYPVTKKELIKVIYDENFGMKPYVHELNGIQIVSAAFQLLSTDELEDWMIHFVSRRSPKSGRIYREFYDNYKFKYGKSYIVCTDGTRKNLAFEELRIILDGLQINDNVKTPFFCDPVTEPFTEINCTSMATCYQEGGKPIIIKHRLSDYIDKNFINSAKAWNCNTHQVLPNPFMCNYSYFGKLSGKNYNHLDDGDGNVFWYHFNGAYNIAYALNNPTAPEGRKNDIYGYLTHWTDDSYSGFGYYFGTLLGAAHKTTLDQVYIGNCPHTKFYEASLWGLALYAKPNDDQIEDF